MKPETYNEILVFLKNDKSKVRDHVCAKVNTLNIQTGVLAKIANDEKFENMEKELSTKIFKLTLLKLIVESIKFYETL